MGFEMPRGGRCKGKGMGRNGMDGMRAYGVGTEMGGDGGDGGDGVDGGDEQLGMVQDEMG